MLKRGYSLKSNKREIMENRLKGNKPIISRFSHGTFDNLDSDREEVVQTNKAQDVNKDQARLNPNELFTANSRMYSRQVVLTKRDSFKEKKGPWYSSVTNCLKTHCFRTTAKERRHIAKLKKLKTTDTDDEDGKVKDYREELDFARMKHHSLALSAVLEAYLLAMVISEFSRLQQQSEHDNCESVTYYSFSLLSRNQHSNKISNALLWLRVLLLILHFGFLLAQLIRPKVQQRLTRLIPFVSIMVSVIFSHLQVEINLIQSQILTTGQFLILPLVLIGQCQAAVAQKFNNAVSISVLYLIGNGFPAYLCIQLSKQQYLECRGTELKPYYLTIILPGILLHFFGFYLILQLVQRLVDTISQERINAEIVRGEYNKILEKMPEGILILSKGGEIKFMNIELRDVLNLQYADKEEDKLGLELKMFKKYNLVDELSSPQEDEEQQHNSESLHNLIESQDWQVDEDRFYELEIFGIQPDKDEDRIFTQIRKAQIEYHEQEATLLLIRNITHIINYEKAKNVGKYQELLTGTMSHEMLTPLNTIINLSQFIELKISQLIMNNQHTKEEQLKIINLTKQQLQLQGNSTFKDQRTDREEEFVSCSESGNSPHTHTSKNDMKIPEFLLSQQRMIIMQGANEQEGLMSSAFEYQQMVKSSAIILQYLVKELIDLNNIKQNKFTPNFQEHDQQSLMESCQEIIDCYKVQAREKNIFLRLCRTSKVFLRDFEIYFDKQRYQQILINLVQNAVKFTSVGGVDVVAEIDQHSYQANKQMLERGSIGQFSNSQQAVSPQMSQQDNPDISCIMSGSFKQHLRGGDIDDCAAGSNGVAAAGVPCANCGFIITRVKDSGVGMKKDVVDNLFQLFALVQKNQTKKGLITTQGIGLGLSVNKQVIEKLGGKIKINTTPGQGTEVLFTVPYKCKNCALNQTHHVPSSVAQNTMMITQNTQQILNRQMTTRRNYSQGDFSFASGKKDELGRTTFKSIANGVLAAVVLKSKSKQPFGGDFQSIYGSFQQSKSQAQDDSQSKQTKGENTRKLIIDCENLDYDSPYGPSTNGLASLQFPSNRGRSDRKNINTQSFAETKHSLQIKMAQLLTKKKTLVNPKNRRLSPNQGNLLLTSPKQFIMHSAVQQQVKYSNIGNPNGANLRHFMARDSTIREINSFGQQSIQSHFMERESIQDARRPNRKLTDRYQPSEKSILSLYNRPGQHSKPKSMTANIMGSDRHKYKSRGGSVNSLSIKVLQHLNHVDNSSGIVYLSANDEVNHHTRELMHLNLNDYLMHGRSNYLRNLCRVLDTSPNDEDLSPERVSNLLQVANQKVFHSISDIKLDLNQQNIKLGDKPIIEGENQSLHSSEMPMSPGFRDTANSFVKDRLCSVGPYSMKNNHATNSGIASMSLNQPLSNPAGTMQPVQQYQSNRSELELFTNAQLMFKKDSQQIKKLKVYDDGLDEEGKFYFNKIEEESDQERSQVQSKEIRYQNYDLNLNDSPPHRIAEMQGIIQHQNESFGHSVHTQSQFKGGLNHHIELSNHGTNQKIESFHPDSNNQSVQQVNRKSRQSIKKSRHASNATSKRGTGQGNLLNSSNDESCANMPRILPFIQNPGEQIDTPTRLQISKQKTKKNHSTNISAFIKQRLAAMNQEDNKQARPIASMDRGRTLIGMLNQTYGSVKKPIMDNLCHCLDNDSIQEPTILIVDDNLFNLIPLELILKEFCGGIKCDKALNGEEAVNLFKKNLQQSQVLVSRASQISEKCVNCGNIVPTDSKFPTYKLVFMDIQMPVMDGYESTRQILQLYNKWKSSQRVTDKEHNLKVIAITSFTNDEAIKNAYECGMTQVLNKPVDVGQIKAVLDKYYHPPQQASGLDVTYSRKMYSAASNNACPGGF